MTAGYVGVRCDTRHVVHSGTNNLVCARAQGIADVIGLIRHHGLTDAFATRIDHRVRGEFKKLVEAIG